MSKKDSQDAVQETSLDPEMRSESQRSLADIEALILALDPSVPVPREFVLGLIEHLREVMKVQARHEQRLDELEARVEELAAAQARTQQRLAEIEAEIAPLQAQSAPPTGTPRGGGGGGGWVH